MNRIDTLKKLQDLVTPNTNRAAVGIKVKVIHTPPIESFHAGTWPPEGMILTVEEIIAHPYNKDWLGFFFKEWQPTYMGQRTGLALFDGWTDPVTPCFEPVDE